MPKRRDYYFVLTDADVVGRLLVDRETFFSVADAVAAKPTVIKHDGEQYAATPTPPHIAKRERRLRFVHVRHLEAKSC